jgi:uncharacterized metal-binding protein YceD (DUF177 family)
MKIRFSKIPPGHGLPLNETLSLDALNQRMQEAKDNEIVFLKAPMLDLLIKKQVQGAEILGNVTTSFRQPCGRCGDEVEQPLSIELQLELKRGTASEYGEPLEDDVGIVIVQDDFIPLEEIIQEHIILSLSPSLLPECKANGDCSLCGKPPKSDVVEGAGNTFLLGDLLKGVKGKK